MAAGQGFKTFATGDILTAADTNGYLMSQTVMVFADSAARTAAITSPQQGMITFLKGTNSTEYYNGSAWVAVAGSSPLTTKGDLYGFSTTNARVPVGTNGQVLMADSTQALGVKWASGGKVLQVVSATYSTSTATTSTTYVDSGLSLSITPSASTSKIYMSATLLLMRNNGGGDTDSQSFYRAVRGSTDISGDYRMENYQQNSGSQLVYPINWQGIDSPATTSATTYKIQMRSNSSNITTTAQASSVASQIVLMEIGA